MADRLIEGPRPKQGSSTRLRTHCTSSHHYGFQRVASSSVRDSADYLGLEAVAHSGLSHEVARPSRIVFKLLSECLDVLT